MSDVERTASLPRGSERDSLIALLDHQRDTFEWKCAGLTESQLKKAAVPPSTLTLLGLLRHMAEVEYYWFESVLLGRDENIGYFGTPDDPDGDFNDLESHSGDDVWARWRAAKDAARAHVATIANLDQVAARPRFWDNEPVTVRYLLLHMIEEYARHLGHADFLRERIDGRTGV